MFLKTKYLNNKIAKYKNYRKKRQHNKKSFESNIFYVMELPVS
jgi:hypothetical protein